MEATTGQVIAGIVIFVAVITGCFGVIAAFLPGDTEQNNVYSEYNKTYAKFNDIQSKTDKLTSSARSTQTQETKFGILDGLISKGWGTLTLTWDALDTFVAILNDLSESYFQVPLWFSGMLITLLGLTIGFALAALYFHWRA